MIDYNNLKNKKVLVMGLGLHGGGVSVVNWLLKQKAKVLVTDLKTKKELKPSLNKINQGEIEYVLGEHREKNFKNADLIIQNPSVPSDSKCIKLAKKNNVPVENEASLFFRLCPAPIIGVTGSKGKSTLAHLSYKLIKSHYKDTVIAGNIRDYLMLDVLPDIKKTTKVILELSSWHLEGMAHLKKSPHIALITNIMPEHLNRYDSMNDYIKAKNLILKFQNKSDWAILNADNTYTRRLGQKACGQLCYFSSKKIVKHGTTIIDENIYFINRSEKEKVFSIENLEIKPQHNLEYFLAAGCLGKILKIPNKKIKKIIKNFKSLPDRLEFIGEKEGIKFYNDTTATLPQATISALKTLGISEKKNIILLAGGADKKLDYHLMGQYIDKYCKLSILFKGEASNKIERSVKKIRCLDNIESMKKALSLALKEADEGDIILLSPGAASFGLFKHEFDRGQQFKKAYKNL